MEDIYKKVVSKGKFTKLLREYNLSGSPTTATASGANPGTLPVTPQPQAAQTAGSPDPKIIAAQKAAKDAEKKAAQAELDALKKAGPMNQARMKQLQDIISGKMQAAKPV